MPGGGKTSQNLKLHSRCPFLNWNQESGSSVALYAEALLLELTRLGPFIKKKGR